MKGPRCPRVLGCGQTLGGFSFSALKVPRALVFSVWTDTGGDPETLFQNCPKWTSVSAFH